MKKRRIIMVFGVFLLCTLLCSCGNSDNDNSQNDQDSLAVSTSAESSQAINSDQNSPSSAASTEPSQSINEEHVEGYMVYYDLSYTTAVNSRAKCLQGAVVDALRDMNANEEYNGTYENELPPELESSIMNYYDLTQLEGYGIKIDNNKKVTVWASISKGDTDAIKKEMEAVEDLSKYMEEEFGSIRCAAFLDEFIEAHNRVDAVYYGICPDVTHSIYEYIYGSVSGGSPSNEKPQL